jgi:energy-coupling factor transport system substrate-specific component
MSARQLRSGIGPAPAVDEEGRASSLRASTDRQPAPSGRPARIAGRGVPLLTRLSGSAAVRFLLAGGTAAFVNWASRIALSLAVPFETAVILAYGIGMAVGFTLYRSFVFVGSDLPMRQQVVRFLGVNAIGATVVFFVAKALLWAALGAGLPQALAEAVAHGLAIGVGAVINFAGHKLFTFPVKALRAFARATPPVEHGRRPDRPPGAPERPWRYSSSSARASARP